jgi:hypothetical protein
MRHAAKLAMALVLAAPVLPVLGEDGVLAALAAPVASASLAKAGPAEAGSAQEPARGPGPALGPALSARRLDALRGGSDTPWSDMKLQGAVSGNSAVAVATGANVIADGSFSNASGLPMVIQNSGANVLIQNATIVNVQFK